MLPGKQQWLLTISKVLSGQLLQTFRTVGLTEVDQLSNQDADSNAQLEHDVERATDVGGRHLGEVDWHRLSRQSDTKSEDHATSDEHAEVKGC